MLMPGKNDNPSNNFGSYEDDKSTPKAQDIEESHGDLIGKSSDTEDRAKNSLLEHIS